MAPTVTCAWRRLHRVRYSRLPRAWGVGVALRCVASEKKQLYWIGPGPGLLEDADLLMIVSVFCPCSCFRRGWAGGDWRTCWKMQRAGKEVRRAKEGYWTNITQKANVTATCMPCSFNHTHTIYYIYNTSSRILPKVMPHIIFYI